MFGFIFFLNLLLLHLYCFLFSDLQTAIKMYKLAGEEKYLLWSVCSIQLQVIPACFFPFPQVILFSVR
jgi:hypothetical protein